ncbi:hypothetical protein L9G74_01740 [Shewanella sp. C32]|uniref:Uncharacterized protein n=1 Tax=Shewanella electrica TaxID=515560 RepID=A0ABT2FIW0_9GAMM|nr:hypothetical protein [Shewanella electrica]MCH1925326.1 hypothetical protein [Shewanella electrica]MCS4555151.1 hypothetical protein [Shewanella electrica]
MDIKQLIVRNGADIDVSHQQGVKLTDEPILTLSAAGYNNIISTIYVNGTPLARLHWANHYSFELLYVPATQVLFVGAGSLSARIHLPTARVIGQCHPFLFWGFSQVHEQQYVLEQGEVECMLYRPDGEIITRAPCDPPYELDVTERGVKLTSDLFGETWLEFPDDAASRRSDKG